MYTGLEYCLLYENQEKNRAKALNYDNFFVITDSRFRFRILFKEPEPQQIGQVP